MIRIIRKQDSKMIRIIRKQDSKMICQNCGTEFTYESEDLTEKQMGMNEWERFVRCPVCFTVIRVK